MVASIASLSSRALYNICFVVADLSPLSTFVASGTGSDAGTGRCAGAVWGAGAERPERVLIETGDIATCGREGGVAGSGK